MQNFKQLFTHLNDKYMAGDLAQLGTRVWTKLPQNHFKFGRNLIRKVEFPRFFKKVQNFKQLFTHLNDKYMAVDLAQFGTRV